MSGSSFDFLIRSILFRIRKTGALRLHQIEHEAIAFPGRSATSTTSRARRPRDRVDARVDHPHVHAVQRPMDARRVEKHHLRVRIVLDAQDPVRVVCGLSETMASLVPTSRFSSVDLPAFGRPMNETNPTSSRPPLSGCRSPFALAASHPHLVDRARARVEHLDAQAVDVELLADRRHAAECDSR
jgi:hypothetical protein